MTESEVRISRSLAPEHRATAIDIFQDAFGSKLRQALPSAEQRQAFVDATLVADRCVTASDGETVLGLAGLKAAAGRYQGGVLDGDTLGLGEMRRLFGLTGMIRAAVVLGFIDHKAEPGELYSDFLAVSTAARGRGIGTKLLDADAAIGHEDGFRWVRLDVIDTNPRAQALYEREGYTVIKEQKLGFVGRLVGFDAAYTMELPLTSPPAVED